MLDDVERRRFLVEPARKDPAELTVRAAHVQLYEGTGQLLNLPGSRGLAGAQPHDRIPDPDRLTRAQRQVPLLAVALVEEAEHGHALRHRRGARRELVHRLGDVPRLVLELEVLLPVLLVGAARRTGGQSEQCAGTKT